MKNNEESLTHSQRTAPPKNKGGLVSFMTPPRYSDVTDTQGHSGNWAVWSFSEKGTAGTKWRRQETRPVRRYEKRSTGCLPSGRDQNRNGCRYGLKGSDLKSQRILRPSLEFN